MDRCCDLIDETPLHEEATPISMRLTSVFASITIEVTWLSLA
jgi:hypothetical protein